MTAPAGRPPTPPFLRPRVVFPVLAALIILSVLLAPRSETPTAAPGLSTYSFGPNGASGLAETARRLGWRVTQLEQPLSDTRPPGAIYAELIRDDNLTTAESHTLLDRVRAGAGLLLILGDGPLRDSLHLADGFRRGALSTNPGDSTACSTDRRPSFTNLAERVPLVLASISITGPVRTDTVHIARIHRTFSPQDGGTRVNFPAVIGVPLGRGRIVAVADPRLFANDNARICRWGAGIVAVRALEWLAETDGAAPRSTITFDEYHHGYGRHPSVSRTIAVWLGQTTAGRTTWQLAMASLLLLAAAAPRPIVPVRRETIPRRSPLEHVAALAQAYEQVRATRTAVRLLVEGMRRRAGRALGPQMGTDDQFLTAVASRFPSLQADTAHVRHALARPVTPAELLGVAATIDRIERSVRP